MCLLRTFLFVFTIVVLLALPNRALAVSLFSDGFESGNMSMWSSSVTDSGNLAVTTGAKLNGSYGLAVTVSNNNDKIVRDNTPDNVSRYRSRFYFNPNSLTITQFNQFVLQYGQNQSMTGDGTFSIWMSDFSTNKTAYRMQAIANNDSGDTRSAFLTITNATHYIETDWKASTAVGANNGYFTVWIDGVQVANLTGIDNDTKRTGTVDLGFEAQFGGGPYTGTYYIDDYASNTDGTAIGAYVAPPNPPTSLSQFKADGSTPLASGAITSESSEVFTIAMSSANGADTLTPQIEVQPIGTSFTNTATHTGTGVAYSGTPVVGTVNVSGLTSDVGYHWQARVTNSGGSGSWVAKGSTPDFIIDTTAPVLGYISYQGGRNTTGSITVTVSDGSDGGSGINGNTRLFERRTAPLSGTQCGTYSAYAPLMLAGGYPNLIDRHLSSGTCYQYRYLVSDNLGHQAKYTPLDLGMGLFSTADTSLFDTYVDDLLANGFTKLRVDIRDYQNSTELARSKAAVIRAIAKGAQVIWGVSSGGQTQSNYITQQNWPTYRQAILDNAQWAQDNGVYEFQLGNEEEFHLDWVPTTSVRSGNVTTVTLPVTHGYQSNDVINIYGCTPSSFDNGSSSITVTGPTTFTYANSGSNGSSTGCKVRSFDEDTLRSNLKSVATEVQSIFTRGNISYTVGFGGGSYQLDKWHTLGRGDIDILAFNAYLNNSGVDENITNAITYFGVDHTYLTEFNLNEGGLAAYSSDESVQASAISTMVGQIKTAGYARAGYFDYIDTVFGARDGTGHYRSLWDVLLANQNEVKVTLAPSDAVSDTAVQWPNPEPTTCGDTSPVGNVDLFQIDRKGKTATLYFTPVSNNVHRYNVMFGYKDGDEKFGGVGLESNDMTHGVQSVTIGYLDPNRAYSFHVIPTNGCAVGTWSNWMSVKPSSNSFLKKFYRYF